MTKRIAYLFLLALLAVTVTTTPLAVFASTGMSNCTEDPESEDCNPQPDRVGNDHDENDEVNRDGPDDEDEENCWGQVSKGLAQKDDDQAGLGEHSSDPVGNDDDNETPREGVGNQDEDHPSDHADAVGGLVDNNETPEDETPDCVDED